MNEDQKWPGIDGDVQIQISQTTFSIDDDGQEEGENQQVQIQINWAINSRLLDLTAKKIQVPDGDPITKVKAAPKPDNHTDTHTHFTEKLFRSNNTHTDTHANGDNGLDNTTKAP